MFQIQFSALMILAFRAVIAQEWPEKCDSEKYIKSLKGEQFFSHIADCVVDGIVLKYMYPNRETPFQDIPVIPVDDFDCTLAGITSKLRSEQDPTLINCLIRGYDETDIGSIDTEKLIESINNNANDIVNTAYDFSHEDCTENTRDDFDFDDKKDQECFLLEMFKHLSKSQGHDMNESGQINDGDDDEDNDDHEGMELLEKINKQLKELLEYVKSWTGIGEKGKGPVSIFIRH